MLRMQLETMLRKKEFRFAFLVSLGVCLWAFCQVCTGFEQQWDANMLFIGTGWTRGWSVYSVLLPFLVVMPFAASFMDDRQKHTYVTIVSRSSTVRYLASKYAATFLGNFVMVSVPFLVNLLLCNLFMQHNGETPFGPVIDAPGMYSDYSNVLYGTNHLYASRHPGVLLASMREYSPVMHNIFFCIFTGVAAGILGIFLLSVSIWLKKYKILLFIPVYLMERAGSVLTEWSYSEAMRDPDRYFTNYTLTDYLAVFTFGGLDYRILFIFCGVVLIFSFATCCYWCRRKDYVR